MIESLTSPQAYGIYLLIGAAVFAVIQFRRFHRTPDLTRQDRHIPADEYRLLGDNWLEPVTPFIRSRFESHTRSRLVIAARCGADPDLNNEAATLPGPASRTKENQSYAADN